MHREAAADKRNNAILADALLLARAEASHRRYTPCRSVPYAPPAHDESPSPSRGGCCSAAGGICCFTRQTTPTEYISCFFRNVYRDIFLRHEKNISVPDHGHFQRAERRLTLDVKGKDHVGEHGSPRRAIIGNFSVLVYVSLIVSPFRSG